MSLTKLFQAGNNLLFPGTEKSLTFFLQCMYVSKYLELVREHLQDGLLVHGLLVGPEVVEPLDHTLLQIVTNLTDLEKSQLVQTVY
jgi:hypothetical protein